MIRGTLVAALCLLAGPTLAASGLWRPAELPGIEEALRSAGIAVDPNELADLQRYPMNAVADLGGGCAAALVSPLGLMLTSWQCARSTIEFNSTAERNLLADGFLAGTLGDELPAAPGLAVLLTQSAQDVTAQVLARPAAGGAGSVAADADQQRIRRLEAACAAAPGFRCRVHPVHGGARYILVKQIEFRDVRLAYAPAAAVVDVSSASDNRDLPSEAGGFALLRVYAGPHGRPAERSELNVPLRPVAQLKLQPAGLKVGDFAMAASYPDNSPHAADDTSLWIGFGNVRAANDGDAAAAFVDLARLEATPGEAAPDAGAARLRLATNSGDFGPYALAGSIPVGFLADLDAAAGSSGAPVLNARAQLVGLLAGKRSANAIGRLSDPARSRSMALDIRFMLWVMDAVDGADRLLHEMGVEPALAHAR